MAEDPITDEPRKFVAMITTTGFAFKIVSEPMFPGDDQADLEIGAFGDKEATVVSGGLPVPQDFPVRINYEGIGTLPVSGEYVTIGSVTLLSNGQVTPDREHEFPPTKMRVKSFSPTPIDAHGGNRAPTIDYVLKPIGGSASRRNIGTNRPAGA